MKWILMIVIFLTAGKTIKAQTFAEWFRQKKTQKKYLLEQIAAFQNYLATMKKGYAIVQNGNRLIHGIKAEDSAQHRQYIQSLCDINPAIRHSKKVTGIVQLQQQVLAVAQYAISHAGSSAVLTPEETMYVKKVFENLLSRCYQSLEELQALLIPGRYQLTNDERIERINSIYADMQVKYSFAISFRQEASVLELRRVKDSKEVEKSKKINRLP